MSFQTLAEAERYLDGLINRERAVRYDYEKLGLERVLALLDAIGNPHLDFECIHITGSKGKGSTALAAECLLRAAGRRVGTYTSPHLVTWRERFRIDGEIVSEPLLLAHLNAIRPAVDKQRTHRELAPSFFDVTTALGFRIFSQLGIDAGVIEVGLGGRLDSTNVVRPRACVLTSVELEHTDKLGDTLEAIALEKAGILKAGVPGLHGPLDDEPFAALLARAIALDVELEEVAPADVTQSGAGLRFRLADGRRVFAPVLGRPQAVNLGLAVRAAERFLDRALAPHELEALARLELPARIEVFGRWVLDCAHTPAAARALRGALAEAFGARSFVLVLAVSSDKNVAGILAELAPLARTCIVTAAEPTRSLDPGQLERLARAAGIQSVEIVAGPEAALERAALVVGPDEGVVATGSIFFAGAVRERLRGESTWR